MNGERRLTRWRPRQELLDATIAALRRPPTDSLRQYASEDRSSRILSLSTVWSPPASNLASESIPDDWLHLPCTAALLRGCLLLWPCIPLALLSDLACPRTQPETVAQTKKKDKALTTPPISPCSLNA